MLFNPEIQSIESDILYHETQIAEAQERLDQVKMSAAYSDTVISSLEDFLDNTDPFLYEVLRGHLNQMFDENKLTLNNDFKEEVINKTPQEIIEKEEQPEKEFGPLSYYQLTGKPDTRPDTYEDLAPNITYSSSGRAYVGFHDREEAEEFRDTISKPSMLSDTETMNGYKYEVKFYCDREYIEEIKEEEAISPTKQNSIGVDLGLERFLTQDNGSYIEIPQFLRHSSKRLARLQHRKDKLKKGSKDKKKLHKAIAKIHQKIARQRLNFQFKIAYLLFEQADIVFVENLKLRNLVRRNKPKSDGKGGFLPNRQSQSSGMNKSWLDAAHGQFVSILEWVAWKLGKRVIKVDPWGTSQHCSNCLQKTPKLLSDRWHEHDCGISIHRDHNSARLIKSVGLGLALRKPAPSREKRLALYATA